MWKIQPSFFNADIHQWMNENICPSKLDNFWEWDMIFSVVLHALWRNWNDNAFSLFFITTDSLVSRVKKMVISIHQTWEAKNILHRKDNSQGLNGRATLIIRALKLNYVGVVTEEGQVANGRILRNQNGDAMFSYAPNLEVCLDIQVNLWQ